MRTFKGSILKEMKRIGKHYQKKFNYCSSKSKPRADVDYDKMKQENMVYTSRYKMVHGHSPQGLYCHGNRTHIL